MVLYIVDKQIVDQADPLFEDLAYRILPSYDQTMTADHSIYIHIARRSAITSISV